MTMSGSWQLLGETKPHQIERDLETMQVWDIVKGKLIRLFGITHTNKIYFLFFSSYRIIVIPCEDPWDVTNKIYTHKRGVCLYIYYKKFRWVGLRGLIRIMEGLETKRALPKLLIDHPPKWFSHWWRELNP